MQIHEQGSKIAVLGFCFVDTIDYQVELGSFRGQTIFIKS